MQKDTSFIFYENVTLHTRGITMLVVFTMTSVQLFFSICTPVNAKIDHKVNIVNTVICTKYVATFSLAITTIM